MHKIMVNKPPSFSPQRFVKIIICLTFLTALGNLFSFRIEDETVFWKEYQDILNAVLVEQTYEGRYGKFFHNSVDYQKFLKGPASKDLELKVKTQLSRLNGLTTVPDVSKKLEKVGLKQIGEKERNQSLAFWINVYNFYTLEQLQRNMKFREIDSMKDLGWSKKEVKVGGDSYTLDEVEHGKVRPLKDPRIHFAVNCASVSCPTLVKKPFYTVDIDERLEKLTYNSFKNPIHLRVEKGFFGESLVTTKLLSWYDEDWGDSAGALNFLRKYMPKDYHKYDDFSASISYNWDLNTAAFIKKEVDDLREDGYSF